MPQTTHGFIDSATLHDAFFALADGKRAQWNSWMAKNLVDSTWLMLFDNLTIIPGPKHAGTRAAPGYEAKLVKRMPELLFPVLSSQKAIVSTKRWVDHRNKPLLNAWLATKRQEEFPGWAAHLRRAGWPVHFTGNGCLFARDDTKWLAELLNVSENTLAEAQHQSQSEGNVRNWSKGRGGDVAELAEQAYLVSILSRGKYHEYLARSNSLQLISHPVRNLITNSTNKQRPIPATNSEQHFVHMLIGSALLEPTADRRVELWIDNIARARLAIRTKAITLPDTVEDSDAINHAITSARRISLPGSASWQRDLLTWGIGGNISAVSAMFLGPWGLVAGLSLVAYKMARGRTVGESLALSATTDSNFRRLGRTVAGKIFR